MEFDKYGCFRQNIYRANPYQHHINKWTWQVQVIKDLGDDDYIMKSIKVIARTALEASVEGIRSFKRQLEERESYLSHRRLAKKMEEEYATETHPEES